MAEQPWHGFRLSEQPWHGFRLNFDEALINI